MERSKWMIALVIRGAMSPILVRADSGDVTKPERIKTAEGFELKGDLARAHEHFDAAARYYSDAVKAAPGNAKLQNKLGITYLQMNDHGNARRAFAKAIKADPKFVNALNNMGAVNCLDKKWNAAIRYLKEALALDETNASAHLNIAEAWAGRGDMDRALTEYARAVELNPDILSGTPQGVSVQVKSPEQKARVQYLLAKALAKRGNIEGALEYLRRAKEFHYRDLDKVYEDQAFAALWEDPRLQKIVKKS